MSFLIYKSSAGSGKTSTLVTEYLKIALANHNGTSYRNILAITFTNKAAHEMKERILSALTNFATGKADDGHIADAVKKELGWTDSKLQARSKALLQELLHHYADLSISTIDSFVSRLVRSFAFDLNLPFRFKLEISPDEMLSEAVESLIEQTGGPNDALTRILTEYILSQTENESSRRIEKPLTEGAFYVLDASLKNIFDELESVDEEQYVIVEKSIRAEIKSYIDATKQLGREIQGFMNAHELSAEDFPGKTKGIGAFLPRLANYASKGHPLNKTTLTFIANGGLSCAKTSGKLKSLAATFDSLFLSRLETVNAGFTDYTVKRSILKNLYKQATLNLIKQGFEKLKEERNTVPLSNFNELVNKLVLNEPVPFIYERIGERYKHYMVDEFQDTSTIQWQNLLPLYSNSLASGNYNMVVGDGKQSIYRFRGGDVEQFLHLGEANKQEVEPFLKEHTDIINRNATPKILEENHRSYREVVDFNNTFFRECAAILPDAWQDVYKEVNQLVNPDKSGGLVNIQLHEAPNKAEKHVIVKEKVLHTVHDVLASGKFQPTDICFLSRTREDAKLITDWLTEAGHKVFTQESLTLEKSAEVRIILRYLNYLYEPHDATLAVSLVASLYEANKITKETSLHTLLHSVKTAPLELHEILEEAGIKIPDRGKPSLTLYTLVQDAIAGFDFEYSTYLSKLSNEVAAFEERNGNNPEGLLKHLDDKLKKLSIQGEPGAGSIRIMTMHKSKGLQFPVVIVPFANWSLGNNSSATAWVPKSESGIELPYAMVSTNKDLEATYLEKYVREEKDKETLDALNLLYVTFTRAKHRLYAIAGKKGVNTAFFDQLKKMEGYNPETQSLIWGTGDVGQSQKPAESKPASVVFKRGDRSKRITLSTHRIKTLEKVGNDEQYRGKLFHAYMERISTHDNRTAANAFLEESGYSKEDQKLILSWADELLNHPDTRDYFSATVFNWRETALLFSGKKLRADRIIESEDKITVLDFKTGEEKAAHVNQIRKYGAAIYKDLDKPIELQLIYLEPLRVERVSFNP